MGFKHIIFYDIERQTYTRILKTDLFESIEFKRFDLEQVSELGLQLLKSHKLIVETKIASDKQLKEAAFYKWEHPSKITNALIELSGSNELICPFAFSKMLKYLDVLMCRHVVFHLKSTITSAQLMVLIELAHLSGMHSLQMIVPYELEYDTDDFGLFLMRQPKLKYILFENSPLERNLENKIFFTRNKLKSNNRKHPQQFNTNLSLFSEGQYNHTYFNRKLFIGEKGEIKNALECEEIHGWIQAISKAEQLVELIKAPAFQKLWFVNKERCEVCKDCEYRYMCVDNRVPYPKEDGYWHHQEACNYDPYEGRWD
jgi:hypothetical protein